MNFHDLRIIIGQIKKTIVCPKCNTKYTDEDIDVIGVLGDEQHFFHAACANCEMEAFIHVNIQFDHDGMILPEFRKLGHAPRMGHISSNEVLDMHNFLKDFQGNFNEMFENSKKLS